MAWRRPGDGLDAHGGDNLVDFPSQGLASRRSASELDRRPRGQEVRSAPALPGTRSLISRSRIEVRRGAPLWEKPRPRQIASHFLRLPQIRLCARAALWARATGAADQRPGQCLDHSLLPVYSAPGLAGMPHAQEMTTVPLLEPSQQSHSSASGRVQEDQHTKLPMQ